MKTATSNNESDQQPRQTTPPVLARVPWLKPATSPAAEAIEPAPAPVHDESVFRPYSVVAAPGLAEPNWDEPPSASAPPKLQRELRIDPPQPLPTVDSISVEAPTNADAAKATSAGSATDDSLRASVAAPPASRPVVRTTPTATTLRFDPPERVAEPRAEETTITAPANRGASETETHSAPIAGRRRTVEPSAWHTWVAAIDNSIRQYHRVIVLAALLTAAGLMMLVLENQHPEHQPAPESLTPTVLNTPTATSSTPQPIETPALKPQPLAATSTAETETAMVASDGCDCAACDSSPAAAPPAEVASSDDGDDPDANAKQGDTPEGGLHQGAIARVSGPQSARRQPAVTTIEPVQPHRELHAQGDSAQQISPPEVPTNRTLVNNPYTNAPSQYRSTGAPEIVLPGHPGGIPTAGTTAASTPAQGAPQQARSIAPRTAQFSGVIQSVPSQATR